jgi:hypothetical protein
MLVPNQVQIPKFELHFPVKCSFIWQNGFRYETITPIKKEICSLHRNTSCHNRFKEKNTMDENRNCIIYTLKILAEI